MQSTPSPRLLAGHPSPFPYWLSPFMWHLKVISWDLVVKNPPTNAGDTGDTGSTAWSGKAPGAGNGNSLQYSCLENSMDRGAWRATVYGVTKSQIRLSDSAWLAKLSQGNCIPRIQLCVWKKNAFLGFSCLTFHFDVLKKKYHSWENIIHTHTHQYV